MPSFDYDITIDFEVFCGTCGEGLRSKSATGYTKGRGIPIVSVVLVEVEACPSCMKNAEEEGYERGITGA